MFLYMQVEKWNGTWKTLEEDAWKELREKVPLLPKWEDRERFYDSIYVDYDQIRALSDAGIELRVDKCDPDNRGAGTMLVKLQDRIRELGLKCDDLAGQISKGATVQVAIPDLGLMLIDEVDYLEDACTLEVQGKLDEGWRILAVCPPNAQRRPDYIFGRRKREE